MAVHFGSCWVVCFGFFFSIAAFKEQFERLVDNRDSIQNLSNNPYIALDYTLAFMANFVVSSNLLHTIFFKRVNVKDGSYF